MVAACPLPAPRGTPIRILRLAEALALRGHEVHLVTYHLGEGEVPGCLHLHRIRHVPTYRKTGPGPTYQKLLLIDPLLCAKLLQVLRSHVIDVVHAHHYEGLMVAAAVPRKRRPLIYDAHTLLEAELPSYPLLLPTRLKTAAGSWLDRHLPRRADHVIAVTNDIKRQLTAAGQLSADRVSVIGNGMQRWPLPSPAAPASADGAPLLVYAGNLAAYQKIDLLLEAFARVRRERPGARLRIITEDGDGWEPYRALARDLEIEDAVEVRHAVFELLPRLLSEADVLLNPRLDCPGIPLKLLNYMAAGKPIVSFAGSGEGLQHGRTAWLVGEGEPAPFAAGILHLLDHPKLATKLGAAARRGAEAQRTWNDQAGLVEEVYARVLGSRSSGG